MNHAIRITIHLRDGRTYIETLTQEDVLQMPRKGDLFLFGQSRVDEIRNGVWTHFHADDHIWVALRTDEITSIEVSVIDLDGNRVALDPGYADGGETSA